ncbi:unnamed protein product, partial [Ectocarpus sp. 12 AP-2014]
PPHTSAVYATVPSKCEHTGEPTMLISTPRAMPSGHHRPHCGGLRKQTIDCCTVDGPRAQTYRGESNSSRANDQGEKPQGKTKVVNNDTLSLRTRLVVCPTFTSRKSDVTPERKTPHQVQ